jgi:hypothetical protein
MRHATWMLYASYPLQRHAKFGAYTELWAGLSEELKIGNNGGYVIPWGRIHRALNQDLVKVMGRKDSGENSVANDFLGLVGGYNIEIYIN